jgi:hypothetical protein
MLSKNALPQMACCGGVFTYSWRGITAWSANALPGLPFHLRNRRAHLTCWRAEQTERHRLEVLHDGGKVKLVAGAGETSEPHAFETVVGLEMGKAHLDALALIPRFEEALCPHEPSRHVAGIFVNITGYLSGSHIGTASRLQRTHIAVEFGGAVAVQNPRKMAKLIPLPAPMPA